MKRRVEAERTTADRCTRVIGWCVLAIGFLVQSALAAQEREPVHVGGAIDPPKKVEAVPPEYTEIARRARIQGVVILQAVIDERGRVGEVKVLKGLPMGLSEQAVEAVRKWRFEPARLNGEAIPVYFNLTINFQLPGPYVSASEPSEAISTPPQWIQFVPLVVVILLIALIGALAIGFLAGAVWQKRREN